MPYLIRAPGPRSGHGLVVSTLSMWVALLSPTPAAHAQTWDGGGANDNFNTINNWNPNALPANNGTANLIFAGVTRPFPVLNVSYDVNGLTFNNTAGNFSILQGINSTLTVRGGGVTNNSGDNIQRFSVPVNFAANSTINLASGDLDFNVPLTLAGASVVTVTGGSGFNATFDGIFGTGTLVKNNPGIVYITSSGGTRQHDLTVNSGELSLIASQTYGASSAITLNGGAIAVQSGLSFVLAGAQFTKAAGGTFFLESNNTMLIQNSGDATFNGPYTTADNATYRVTGAGSTFTLQSFDISQNADVELLNGGELIATGSLAIRQTGTLTVNSGILTMEPGQQITNEGTLNFNSGRITLGQGLGIGAADSLLGATLTLTPGRSVEVLVPGSATTVASPGSLVIDGGVLRTDRLVNQGGTIDFRRGFLDITGSSNFNVSPAGPLGASVTLGPGATLEATNANTVVTTSGVLSITGGSFSTDGLINNGSVLIEGGAASVQSATIVASNALLSISGGNFLTNDLTNNGSVLIEAGSATVLSTATNAAGAQLFVQRNLTLGGLITNAPGARLELANGTGRISGDGAIQNNGLITGHGTIANPVTNSLDGEIRAETGKTLTFTGRTAPNDGRINLLGGQIDFSDFFTNSPNGRINGRGTLTFANDFLNLGIIQFSTGLTDVFGLVTQSGNGKIIVSGGGSATFYGPVEAGGDTEFRVSQDGRAIFFGPVDGSNFTGPGIKFLEFGPSSLSALQTTGSTVVEAPASLTTAYIREAALTVAGFVTLPPAVRGGGTSKLGQLDIQPGGTFDLADNDLIVEDPDVSAVNAAIASARNGAAEKLWAGPGLTSSIAAENPLFGLAAILNDDGHGNPLFANFAGLTTAVGDALVAYTFNGDSDLDGEITADDYHRLDRGFLERRNGYRNGDIDYSDSINLDDYALIDAAFLGQAALSLATPIPEPRAVFVLASMLPLLPPRPRRRRRESPVC